jgi:asparagine synthase (glutamine-hydrolysing)
MCGFCLYVGDADVDIRALTESIRHRGPDSTGYFVEGRVRAGFNRLAIVDSDPRADQPMVAPGGRHVLLFNGEIYNHAALGRNLADADGIELVTRSDTEVLLHGLLRHGAAFLRRLDGIFALAFIDLDADEVLLARDTFGVKPLYYRADGRSLSVSSEVRPLERLHDRPLHRGNLAQLVATGSVVDGGSLIDGVDELSPNTSATFRSGRLLRRETIRELTSGDRASASIEEVRAAVIGSIRAQQPTVPYGVLFSGGIDSTLVLDACAQDDRLVGAYSVDVAHPDMSERGWQEVVLRHLGTSVRHQVITMDRGSLSTESLVRAAGVLDQPMTHPNFVGALLLAGAAAADGAKVLLSGEGADELFLGYRWFLPEAPAREFLEYVPLADVAEVLDVPVSSAVEEGLSTLDLFQHRYLRRWLIRQDLTGMASSVEVRVPFLGRGVSQLANELSTEYRLRHGTKWLLRALLAPTYPSSLLDRRKVGFDFPLDEWMDASHVELARACPLVDPVALDRVLARHAGSHVRNRLVFCFAALAAWCERMADR